MTNLESFELIRQEAVPEVRGRAFLFRHAHNRAEVLSIENDDENKVFGITFRTPPADSTGVPHILEHTVLCGSRKYPVKEPFVELIKGSLKTFLNAMTYPDKTCYPVASQNLQDFRNLIDVYLDAVFHPRLLPQHFQQEGWHYEPDGVDRSLRIVGIVYNEMKGSYSSPDRLLGQYSQESLFPDNPYGLDSGGHPRSIPELTYEQFKRFHETYYHPSNARIFFYGDDKTEDRLRLLDPYLKDIDLLEIDSRIPLQPRFDRPRTLTRTYDPGQEAAGGNRTLVTVNWLLPETLDPEVLLASSILSHILIGTPGSPLRKALIDSGLGEDLAGSGLENEIRQMYFSTGLKGTADSDAEKVEPLILDTLGRIERECLDPRAVEASMNTVEFRLRENNTGGFPRGLAWMLRSLATWLYDGDPLAPVRFEAPLAAVKKNLSAGGYFESLIRRHFLQNPHRTTLLLRPDPGLDSRAEAEEKARLARVRVRLSEQDVRRIVEDARSLKQMQETPDPPEALAAIPVLELSDLPRQNKTIPISVHHDGGAEVLFHDLFTNGIVYLDLGFDLHLLPQDLLPFVPLFGRALLEMGTEREDFVSLSQRIGQKTGGIWPMTIATAIRESSSSAARLFLRGKAMLDQADDFIEILRDVLLTVQLDNQDRFRQMVLDEKAGAEAQLVPAGHSLVGARLGARLHEAGWVSEQMGGVSQLFFLRQLAKDVDSGWQKVLDSLEQVRTCLLNRPALVCNVTADQSSWQAFQPGLSSLVGSLPEGKGRFHPWSPQASDRLEGLTIPSQVNFVGKGANLYGLGYRYHGSAVVIARYLRTTWLWERVRVQGGAYGGFCSFDRRSGVFSFLSYRDPNLLETLRSFDGACRFLRDVHLGEQELARGTIGAIGELDTYELPDAKGFTSMVRHLTADSEEVRQRMREEIFSTKLDDFRTFAEVLEQFNQKAQVVVMGSREAIEGALESKGKDWLEIVQVL